MNSVPTVTVVAESGINDLAILLPETYVFALLKSNAYTNPLVTNSEFCPPITDIAYLCYKYFSSQLVFLN